MSVREYIGARYVPVFADPIQWDNTNTYEPLTMVQNEGETYISKTYVPTGIQLTNENYWAFLTNWNAQIEQYRQEVLQYNSRISTLENDLPVEDFDSTNTVKAAINSISDIIPASDFDSTNTVKAAIDTVDDKLGNGFTSEDTIKDYIDAVDDKLGNGFTSEDTVNDHIEALDAKINSNIRDMAWNCRFRQIIGTNYILSETHSAQGMTMFEINDTRYLAQAAILTQTTIILYNYDDGTEVTRISGNYGHINDMCYRNGVLYALEEANSKVHKFNVTSSTITFNSTEIIPITTAALQIMDDGSWFTAQSQGQGLGMRIYHYTSDFGTELKSYFVPFEGNAIIQGISVNNNAVFLALTTPNTLVYYNIDTDDWYYIAVPKYIGHCMTDEIEGVYFDEDSNIFFNTNSTVDMQVLTTIFETNLIHNVEKEVDSSLAQNRYQVITAKIDATNGDLVSPGEYNHSFRLVGDAINYAKALGNFEVTLDFLADYPYPIVANGSNLNFLISDSNLVIQLNGLYMRYCRVNIANVTRFILNPTDLEMFVYNNIIYGGYILECDFDINVGTWHALNSPNAYDATHKRLNFLNSTVRIQETAYYRFYNCIVLAGSTSQVSTSEYERTGMLAHVS